MQAARKSAPELSDVIAEVLGNLAFVVVEADEAVSDPAEEWLEGEISYDGPLHGTVRCWCPRGLAARLAANLLGIEPEALPARGAAEDALREFLNVLCGQLVTIWHGTLGVFTLTIPQVRVCPQRPAWPAEACQLTCEGAPLVCVAERSR